MGRKGLLVQRAGKYTCCMYKKTSKLPNEFNLSSRSDNVVRAAGKRKDGKSPTRRVGKGASAPIFLDECYRAVVPPLTRPQRRPSAPGPRVPPSPAPSAATRAQVARPLPRLRRPEHLHRSPPRLALGRPRPAQYGLWVVDGPLFNRPSPNVNPS